MAQSTYLRCCFPAASEFHGATTVSEALQLDLPKLAAKLGVSSALEALLIQDLTTRRMANTVSERLDSLLASTPSTQKLILNQRLFVSNPPTLQELAERIGVSRERVRQMEQRVLEAVKEKVDAEFSVIATFVSEQLDPITTAVELDHSIARVFNDDSLEAPAIDLACRILRSRLNYSCVDGTCFNKTATDVAAALRDVAGAVADDVGLIDEEALKDHLPNVEWVRFMPQLIERCEFQRIGDRLALRDTNRARVKVALLTVGRAATREEIAAMSDLDPDRTGPFLSSISSLARIDKTRWWLADQIDDIYEGIPAEIIQRINEDGGATALERLCEDLPRLFGVSKSSVQAYVSTPQFNLNDGYISLADPSSITLRHLEDVIHGRDEFGNPWWRFLVSNRYLDGYSLRGVPPELARELGCEPNGKTLAVVTHPEGSGELSVVWRLSSMSGASLGQLADPLRRLGVSGGDRVRVVIKGPGIVELRRESPKRSVEEPPGSLSNSWLERMKSRDRVL